jgi:hypothetical protein
LNARLHNFVTFVYRDIKTTKTITTG